MRVLDAGARELLAVDVAVSRRAGVLLGTSRSNHVLDALVALAATDRPGSEVVTSDPEDLHHHLKALDVRRAIRLV